MGGVILTGAAVEALSLAQLRLSFWVLLRRLWPPVRFGAGCAAWAWVGDWPRGCAADTPDIAALFPLTNNRPLSEGAAGASRLGEP